MGLFAIKINGLLFEQRTEMQYFSFFLFDCEIRSRHAQIYPAENLRTTQPNRIRAWASLTYFNPIFGQTQTQQFGRCSVGSCENCTYRSVTSRPKCRRRKKREISRWAEKRIRGSFTSFLLSHFSPTEETRI